LLLLLKLLFGFDLRVRKLGFNKVLGGSSRPVPDLRTN